MTGDSRKILSHGSKRVNHALYDDNDENSTFYMVFDFAMDD